MIQNYIWCCTSIGFLLHYALMSQYLLFIYSYNSHMQTDRGYACFKIHFGVLKNASERVCMCSHVTACGYSCLKHCRHSVVTIYIHNTEWMVFPLIHTSLDLHIHRMHTDKYMWSRGLYIPSQTCME